MVGHLNSGREERVIRRILRFVVVIDGVGDLGRELVTL